MGGGGGGGGSGFVTAKLILQLQNCGLYKAGYIVAKLATDSDSRTLCNCKADFAVTKLNCGSYKADLIVAKLATSDTATVERWLKMLCSAVLGPKTTTRLFSGSPRRSS